MKKKIIAAVFMLMMALALVPASSLQVEAAKKVVKVKKVKLNKTKYTMKKGDKLKLKATLSPKKTTQKKLVWSSSKKKVATVSKKGVVKAKKDGKTTITVKVKGTSKKAKCKITVKTPVQQPVQTPAQKPVQKVTGISFTESQKTLTLGDTYQTSIKVLPANAANKAVTYTSSNSAVAAVDATGKVTAKASGTVTITATAKDGSGKQGTMTIKVEAPKLQVVSFEINDIVVDYQIIQEYSNVTNGYGGVGLEVSKWDILSHLDSIKPSFSQEGVTWEIVEEFGGLSFKIRGIDGTEKGYYIERVHAEGLEITSWAFSDGSDISWGVSTDQVYVVRGPKAFSEMKDSLQIGLGEGVVESSCTPYESEDRAYWEIILTGAEDVRTYEVEYYMDESLNLCVENITSSDGCIDGYEFYRSEIYIYGNKAYEEALIENMIFECNDAVSNYELVDLNLNDGNWYAWELTLQGTDGLTRTYYVYYIARGNADDDTNEDTDDDANADNFCLTSVVSDGDLVTNYQINEMTDTSGQLGIVGTKDTFGEIKDSVTFVPAVDTIAVEVYQDKSNGEWFVRISDETGNEKLYWILYVGSNDEAYGSFGVTSVTSTDEVQPYIEKQGSVIAIVGTAEKFADIKDSLIITCGMDGLTYSFEKNGILTVSLGEVPESIECWTLRLSDSAGNERVYKIYYQSGGDVM